MIALCLIQRQSSELDYSGYNLFRDKIYLKVSIEVYLNNRQYIKLILFPIIIMQISSSIV